MKNQEVAELLNEIADILEIKNVAWKPIAYRKASRAIESLSEDIEAVYKKSGIKGLEEVPGVGESIGKKVAEFLNTGKITELEKLKKSVPETLLSMMEIPGLGPKKVARLYKTLKIKSLPELEAAAKAGKIRKIEGFGEKSEEDILMGLELVKKGRERILLSSALEISNSIVNELKKRKEVSKIEVGGSIRRRKETARDIDILVSSKNPEKVMDYFTKLPDVKTVLAKGKTKSSVVLREGVNCDLRVIEEKSYGAALAYFTGSKDFNVAMRQIAIKKGMKLSEYGLFSRKGGYICGRTEQEIFSKLGLVYAEPEMREDTSALALKKPVNLIKYNSIRGDLHLHTRWSDGFNTTEEVVKEAVKLGYEYIAITDHSKSEHVANGMDEKRLRKYLDELRVLQRKYRGKMNILKGSEVDILKDGSLDYSGKILEELDIVIASVHSGFKTPKDEMTKRIVKAINSGQINVLCHPTGRLINQRNPYDVDLDAVFEAAKKNNVAMEINSFPSRLDLKDIHIKAAVEKGVKMAISTDSHSTSHLKFIELGIAQARRGWCGEKDIINTMKFEKLAKFLMKE
ncbi:MAG TPA: DNA polymerase/3'-5' exonuclease PolX [Candidatus Nanoarchaeia archaeon]|nr:DNA polymerase/3'-5' exonuclease PolX [Candidatus Nanoarchaeia archaeon]